MDEQKKAVSTSTIIGIIVVILVLAGVAYWYTTGGAAMGPNGNEASTTPDGTGTAGSDTSSVTTNITGTKTYSNFKYGYTIEFPADAQNNISTPESVTFSFKSGTSTPDGMLKIGVGVDVTHLAYCLTVPQGATNVATTTVNGIKFLSYVVSGATGANVGATYYRTLHEAPYGSTCYDIQKYAQGSAALNSKLNNILESFTFAKF